MYSKLFFYSKIIRKVKSKFIPIISIAFIIPQAVRGARTAAVRRGLCPLPTTINNIEIYKIIFKQLLRFIPIISIAFIIQEHQAFIISRYH